VVPASDAPSIWEFIKSALNTCPKGVYMRTVLLILGFLFFVLLPAAAEAGPSGQPLIKVGLWSNQTSVILSADTAFSIADADKKYILGSYKAKEKVTVKFAASGMAVNGKPVAAREITVVVPAKASAGIEVNRRAYRGTVSVRRTVGKNGLTVVNTLPLEEYVYGIIAREISPAWPPEAVRPRLSPPVPTLSTASANTATTATTSAPPPIARFTAA
jgi:stage II sporulation protein D